MKRRTAICLGAGLLLLAALPTRADEAFALITPEQFEAELSAQAAGIAETPVPRKRGLFPMLHVIAPEAGAAALASPVRMEVHFETSPDARIVPSTFRVLYGLMKLDLTGTLVRHAILNEERVVVERALVPPGTHRLLLQIADDRGRVNEHELLLKVIG